jgi:uncharacterized protein
MTATPIGDRQRLDVIDGLRGFALAGVLLANLRSLTLFEDLPQAARALLPSARVDRLLEPAITVFVEGKFITLFSLLFGIGFALQMGRIASAGEGSTRYLRRLAILMLIGMAHATLLWWGDILRYYALMAVVLLAVAPLRTRALVWLGLATTLLAYPLARLVLGDPSLLVPPLSAMSVDALRVFQGHDWFDVVRENHALNTWALFGFWGLFFFVAGRLMLGAALCRSGWLHDVAAHASVWKRMLWVCLPLGLALTLFVQAQDYGRLPALRAWFAQPAGHALLTVVRDLSTLSLGLGYLAAFVLLFQRGHWQRWLGHLVPVGRMALTNYLMQTLIGVGVFYGIGLGVGPRFGLVGVVVAWAVVFFAQIVFSRWWLARFRFGPAEWLWRSLTYGQRQPIRR